MQILALFSWKNVTNVNSKKVTQKVLLYFFWGAKIPIVSEY